jgi:hypothetical protein
MKQKERTKGLTKKAGVRRQKAGGAGVSIETLVLGSESSL